MSNYKRIARNPGNGNFEMGEFLDDYWGHHEYAVKFESDSRYWPLEKVKACEITDFWADDVIAAFKLCRPFKHDEDTELVTFLNEIQVAYKNRWKNDPITGDGATDKSVVLRKNRKSTSS